MQHGSASTSANCNSGRWWIAADYWEEGTHGLSCLKMNMLFGITVLAGLISSNSSFSDLQVSGSLLFTERRKEGRMRAGQKNRIWTRRTQSCCLIWSEILCQTQHKYACFGCTCDCGELQRRLNVWHVYDHTGAELTFNPLLLCLILVFVRLWDIRCVHLLRGFFLCGWTLVIAVVLAFWCPTLSPLTFVTMSEEIKKM